MGCSAVLTQMMASNVMDFGTLAERSLVNSKKYAAVLAIVIKEFENRFQDCKKIISVLVYLQLHFQSAQIHYLKIFKRNV